MDRKIIIGEINEQYKKTPIELFKTAIKLSEKENFTVHTNNPQFIEAIYALCEEKSIEIYLKLNRKYAKISYIVAMNYLGDLYDIIDALRIMKVMDGYIDCDFLKEEINDYESKYRRFIENE